jgi:multidrug efflux pump subunit AcrB
VKDPIAWFAQHRVAANLLMVAVVAGGLMTLPRITREVFPDITPDLVTVRVAYPGATPDEVETTVVARIEEAIRGLGGIRRVTSTASEGAGVVSAELFVDADPQRVLSEIESRVAAIPGLPQETERPVVERPLIRRQVVNVAVSGSVGERTLKDVAERVRDEIAALEGITQVDVTAVRDDEISIEISEAALRRYRLTFDEVVEAVRSFSLDLAGGTLKTRGGEIRLRTLGQARTQAGFEEIVLRSRPDGTRLTLGDVAVVRDGFRESDRETRFDGEPAALVRVFRVGGQSALDVSEKVARYVAEASAWLPDGVRLETWDDDARVLRGRIETLLRNARSGLLLVFVGLALFLRPRLAFWVGAGIPVAFLGALWVMPAADVSLNLVSLFAFILVLGILVDDSIIVGENIYTRQRSAKSEGDLLASAIRATREVAAPVIFGVLTTVVAFTPLLFVPGAAGEIWRQIPVVVIAALIFSLLKCFLVLPAHLGHRGRLSWRLPAPFDALFETLPRRAGAGLERLVERVYVPLLDRALRGRYVTLATSLALLLVAAGAVGGGWVRTTFFPPVEGDRVVASVLLPPGTPFEITQSAVEQLERAAEQVRSELEPSPADRPVVEHVLTSAGEGTASDDPGRDLSGASGSNAGSVEVALVAAEDRDVSAAEFARRWREATGPIPDAVELSFSSSLFTTGDPIDIELRGFDVAALGRAAAALRDELASYPGVRDVRDSFLAGKEELELRLRPGAAALGLSVADLARQVRQGFYGEEVQRIARRGEDVKVMVRYPRDERRSLGDFESLRIRTPLGDEVPLSVVAEARRVAGPTSIRRADGGRVVNVVADVDLRETSPAEVLGDLRRRVLPDILAGSPGVTYSFEGEQREQRESLGGLGRNFAFAMFVIFALLALLLRSYALPLLVMSTIPLGAVGALAGHALLGLPLSFSSVVGMVALAGVVVNDSLVLVDWTNRRRQEGCDAGTAVRRAGASRFRPIFLTSLTTCLGLTPLLLEQSVQAQFLIPMAVSIAFGVAAATAISLLIVPSAYLVLEDLKRIAPRLRPAGAESDIASAATGG